MSMQPVASNNPHILASNKPNAATSKKMAENAYAEHFKQWNINQALVKKEFDLLPEGEKKPIRKAASDEARKLNGEAPKHKSGSNIFSSNPLVKNFIRCQKEEKQLAAEKADLEKIHKSDKFRIGQIEEDAKEAAAESVKTDQARLYFMGETVEQNLPPEYKHMAKFLDGQVKEADAMGFIAMHNYKHTSFIGTNIDIETVKSGTNKGKAFAKFNSCMTPEQYVKLNNFCFNKRREYVLDQIKQKNEKMRDLQYNTTFTIVMPDSAQVNVWKQAKAPDEKFKNRYLPPAYSSNQDALCMRLEDGHVTPKNDEESKKLVKANIVGNTVLYVTEQDLSALEEFLVVEP